MSGFRAKQMQLNEWAAFENQFGALLVQSGGDPALALFRRSEPGSDISTLLVPPSASEVAERLSPGGWEHFPDPQQHHWQLLVGTADAAGDFGITLG
jgi:hypothetical protein